MSETSLVLPDEVEKAAENALLGIIPEKSKKIYNAAFEKFEKWCAEKGVKHINEKVLLAYFEGKKGQKSSTLWSQYSMLRSEINLRRSINIKKFPNLLAFLKRRSDGYQAKKSNVLTRANIAKFLVEADNKTHLMAKV